MNYLKNLSRSRPRHLIGLTIQARGENLTYCVRDVPDLPGLGSDDIGEIYPWTIDHPTACTCCGGWLSSIEEMCGLSSLMVAENIPHTVESMGGPVVTAWARLASGGVMGIGWNGIYTLTHVVHKDTPITGDEPAWTSSTAEGVVSILREQKIQPA